SIGNEMAQLMESRGRIGVPPAGLVPIAPLGSAPMFQAATMAQEQTRIERIIRKHVHDVRNHINSLDLEAVLLGEIVSDPEVTSTLLRMRSQLRELEAGVKDLVFRFADPEPADLTEADLLHFWKEQVAPFEDSNHRIE